MFSSEVVFGTINQRVINLTSDNACNIWKKLVLAVTLSSQWACKRKLAHEFGLPPLLLLNQNRDFDLEANSFYKPFKFIVLFMLNPNLNQEGADTLITSHLRQLCRQFMTIRELFRKQKYGIFDAYKNKYKS